MPGFVFVHLVEVRLFESIDSILEISENLQMVREYFAGCLERGYDDPLLLESRLQVRHLMHHFFRLYRTDFELNIRSCDKLIWTNAFLLPEFRILSDEIMSLRLCDFHFAELNYILIILFSWKMNRWIIT